MIEEAKTKGGEVQHTINEVQHLQANPMSLYGITSVRLDQRGRVVSAVIGKIDGGNNSWIGTPAEWDANDSSSE